MNSVQLKCFLEVAKELNFARAAENLHFPSQPQQLWDSELQQIIYTKAAPFSYGYYSNPDNEKEALKVLKKELKKLRMNEVNSSQYPCTYASCIDVSYSSNKIITFFS